MNKREKEEFAIPATKRRKLQRRSTLEISDVKEVVSPKKIQPTTSMTEPTEKFAIKDLIVTQKAIRDTHSLPKLIEHSSSGGNFHGIILFTFEDGKYYLHDGHHRVLAHYISGRSHILPEEYLVIHSTYADIGTVLFEKKFVTPYDPRIELRKNNFGTFKTTALSLYDQGKEVEARAFIIDNREQYVIPRTLTSMLDLATDLEIEKSSKLPSVSLTM